MKWQRLKAKRAEYDGETIKTVVVENSPDVLHWLTDTESREIWDRRIRLTGDNRQSFRAIFGKPSFCWKGSEFYFHCWLLKPENMGPILLLTAKGKGTCYEAVTGLRGIEYVWESGNVIRFLDWLVDELSCK